MLPGLTASRVQLFTPLTSAECARRLSEAIDRDNPLRSRFGSKPVLGYATERSLRLRKRIRGRNSFQAVLRASLQPEGSGTLISGTAGVDPLVQGFVLLWIGLVTVLSGAFSVPRLVAMLGGEGPMSANAWLHVALPPAMIIVVFGLLRSGRSLARDEARFLTDFLIATLDARSFGADRVAS